MAEIDPVILRLIAETGKFQADLRKVTSAVDNQLGRQEKRVKKLEAEFRKSSGAISASLKGLAGTLATAFTGRELVGLLDSFTRLQNQLRVSGLEGERLEEVQTRLLALSGRYGVSIDELANLYGKSSQAAAELGASEEQLLQVTTNSAAALKITGTSAVQAQGALLGLTQALSSGKVRAEEFNQINEGGLRPLLQAAANTERFGGSVAALRNGVVAGTVSSQEFFQSILAGSAELEGKAAKATLTLQGAFTALNSQLVVYVGGAASANGVTDALAAGIQKLAENLDIVIPALAKIAALVGVKLVAGFGAATVASLVLRGSLAGTAAQMGVAGAASFALQARLAGAATSAQALAFAARGAGASLLAAFGGPVGLAIGAISIALLIVANRTTDAQRAADAYAKGQETAAKATTAAREAAERLASAHGRTRVEALAAAKAEQQLTIQKIAGAKASLQLAQTELARTRSENARALARESRTISGAGGGPDRLASQGVRGGAAISAAEQSLAKRAGELNELGDALNGLTTTINAASVPTVVGVGVGSPTAEGTGANRSPSSPSGTQRDTAESERRYADELDSIRSRIQQAESQRATSAEERAEYESRQIELAEASALRSLEADEELNAIDKEDGRTRREVIKERLIALGEAERDNVAFRQRAEIEQRNLELADERGRAEQDNLRLQFDLADTEKDRRAIALQILDAEERLLRSRFEAIVASDTANDAERERARIALEALNAQGGARRESTERQFEGPLARFARSTKDDDTAIQEAVVRRVQDINETITNSFTDALGIKDPFLKELISIFLDKNVFGPLAEALSGASGGGGSGSGGLLGAIGGLFGGLFGGGGSKSSSSGGQGVLFGKFTGPRSSGGRVNAGSVYRVNEGASAGRVEGFQPDVGGQIIPLGRMNAMQGGGGGQSGGTSTVRLELSGDLDARIERVTGPIALEIVRVTAPSVVDAAVNETFRQANRPGL